MSGVRCQENRTAGRNEQCEGVDRAQARSLEADGSRPVAARSVEVRLSLTPEQAAALKWVAEKLTHDDCMQHTYAHRSKEERIERAYEMLDALREVEKALDHVRSWPWIETGQV